MALYRVRFGHSTQSITVRNGRLREREREREREGLREAWPSGDFKRSNVRRE